MTLIAHLELGEELIILGDILGSRPKGASATPGARILLPTGYVDWAHATKTGFAPELFCQKVVLLSEQAALAYCGPLKHVPKIIRHLENALARHGPQGPIVWQEAARMPRKWTKGVGLILMVAGPDNTVFRGHLNVIRPKVPPFTEAMAAGTGRNYFYEILSRFYPPDRDDGPRGGLAAALGVVANFADLEVGNGVATPALFGGAYEVCYLSGGRIQKLDKLVVAKLQLRLFPDGYELNIMNLVQTRYDRSDLLISALVAAERGPVHFRSYARSIAHQDLPPPEPHEAEFNGDHYSLSIDVIWQDWHLPEDIVQGFPFVSGEGDRPFNIEEFPGAFQVDYRTSWLIEIIEHAKRMTLHYFPEAEFDAPPSGPLQEASSDASPP
jgi:hypothetical protein